LCSLLPLEPEPRGLLALMLLHDARRAARTSDAGDLVLLEDQDRSLWNREQIEEGLRLVVGEGRTDPPGADALQAAIAAEHCRARRAEDTDWPTIARLYDLLVRVLPSPVVALNRAVAVAMADGLEVGLERIAELKADGALEGYYLLWSAEADLLRR